MFNVYLYNECPSELNPQNYPSYWIWKIEKALSEEVPQGAIRMTLLEITAYKQTHKANINAWTQTKVDAYIPVRRKVIKAIESANDLIRQFAAENIAMGITQAGKTKLIADILKDVFYYAQTGSLYECIAAIDAIVILPEYAPFITEERKTDLKNKVLDVLADL